MKFRLGELFCGPGGLGLGAMRARTNIRVKHIALISAQIILGLSSAKALKRLSCLNSRP